MTSQAHERLSDDHQAVGEIFNQLPTALNARDMPASLASLDLLWARLAVHIRAEHLHLFPAVITRMNEAQTVVDRLRSDHDFFMRELARAIGILREMPQSDEKWNAVSEAVRGVEERLVTHNELEETTIYPWATAMLTDSEQSELVARINAELENRPPRFSLEAWTNQ
jgi:iron-sulfur cluster repair protein YtfE (RIC family)